MATLIVVYFLAALANPAPAPGNWCKVGQNVMIPDGREGPVVQATGNLCKVLAYGEDRMSLWTYDLLEPSDPQFSRRSAAAP
ncbi:MAG: hypothetical protein U1F47_01470 [Hyphomicrobiales bacterium]